MPATLDRAPFEEPIGRPRRKWRTDIEMWVIEARWTAKRCAHLRSDWWVRKHYHTRAQRDAEFRALQQNHKGTDYIEFRVAMRWKEDDVS